MSSPLRSPAAAATTSSSPSASRARTRRASTRARPRLTINSRTRSMSVTLSMARVIATVASSARHRALELVAAEVQIFVEMRVLDRDRDPAREHEQSLLVSFVELAVLLLRQVDVAPGLAMHQHRRPEKRGHARVRGREAVAARVPAYVGQPERLGMADQLPEDSPSAREARRSPGAWHRRCRRSGSARSLGGSSQGSRRRHTERRSAPGRRRARGGAPLRCPAQPRSTYRFRVAAVGAAHRVREHPCADGRPTFAR